MGIRVAMCLIIESAVILLATFYMSIRGWALLCGAECGEGEVWVAYIIGAGISTMVPLVYVVLSLILGRTPLMIVLRVPGLWKALRKGQHGVPTL